MRLWLLKSIICAFYTLELSICFQPSISWFRLSRIRPCELMIISAIPFIKQLVAGTTIVDLGLIVLVYTIIQVSLTPTLSNLCFQWTVSETCFIILLIDVFWQRTFVLGICSLWSGSIRFSWPFNSLSYFFVWNEIQVLLQLFYFLLSCEDCWSDFGLFVLYCWDCDFMFLRVVRWLLSCPLK